MANYLKLGVIGTGGIAQGHIRAFRELDGATVEALADTDPAMIDATLASAKDASWHPATFADYRKMLDDCELDAVLICTPHTLHHEQAMACLEAGCHLMLEKPMVTRSEHAREIIRRAEADRRVIVVTYQRHYAPVYRAVRERIECGELGRLTAICGYLAQSYLPYIHTWRGDPNLCSQYGQFNDSGSHLVAAMLWCSSLRPLEAWAFSHNGPARVNLNTAATIRFENECLGTLSINGNVAEGFEEELVFWGDKGGLYIRNGQLLSTRDGRPPEPVAELPPARSLYQEFLDAIRGRGAITSGAEIGLRVAELTEMAFGTGNGAHCKAAATRA